MAQTQESKTKSVTVWIPVKDGHVRARGILNRYYRAIITTMDGSQVVCWSR